MFHIVIIANVLAVMLWRIDSVAALKCNGYRVKSLVVGHLDKGNVHWKGAWYVNVRGSVHWKGVYKMGECRLGV